MKTSRNFIKLTVSGSAAVYTSSCLSSEKKNVTASEFQKDIKKTIIVSTCNFISLFFIDEIFVN